MSLSPSTTSYTRCLTASGARHAHPKRIFYSDSKLFKREALILCADEAQGALPASAILCAEITALAVGERRGVRRILVTGGTGRIGSRFVPRLLKHEQRVRVLARDARKAQPLEAQGAEVILGDLRDTFSITSAVSGIDIVIHLAATVRDTSVDRHESDIVAAEALARSCIEGDVSRLIFASSNLVYGDCDAPGPAREEDDVRPKSPYASSKAETERRLLAFGYESGLSVIILRLAFVYGDADPHLIEFPILAEKHAWPEKQYRHLVHHEDVAQALLLGIEHEPNGCDVFNIGDDCPLAVRRVVEFIDGDRTSGRYDAGRIIPRGTAMDTKKARSVLGFRPLIPSLFAAGDLARL